MCYRVLVLFVVFVVSCPRIHAEVLSGFTEIEKPSLSKKKRAQFDAAVLSFLRLDEKRSHATPRIEEYLQQAQAQLEAGDPARAHQMLMVFRESGIREARFLLYKVYSDPGYAGADESFASHHLEAAAIRNHTTARRLITEAYREKGDRRNAHIWAIINQYYEERRTLETRNNSNWAYIEERRNGMNLWSQDKKRGVSVAPRYRAQIYAYLAALGVAPEEVPVDMDDSQLATYLQAPPREAAQLELSIEQGAKHSTDIAGGTDRQTAESTEDLIRDCTAATVTSTRCAPEQLLVATKTAHSQGDTARAKVLAGLVIRAATGSTYGNKACQILEEIEDRPVPTKNWTGGWYPGFVTMADCSRKVGWVKAKKTGGSIAQIQYRQEKKGKTTKYPQSEVVSWGIVLTAADVDWGGVSWGPGEIVLDGELRKGQVSMINLVSADGWAAARWTSLWFEDEPGAQVFTYNANTKRVELVVQYDGNKETVYVNDGRDTCLNCDRHYLQIRTAAEEAEAARKRQKTMALLGAIESQIAAAKKESRKEEAAAAERARQAEITRRAAAEKAETNRRLAERDARMTTILASRPKPTPETVSSPQSEIVQSDLPPLSPAQQRRDVATTQMPAERTPTGQTQTAPSVDEDYPRLARKLSGCWYTQFCPESWGADCGRSYRESRFVIILPTSETVQKNRPDEFAQILQRKYTDEALARGFSLHVGSFLGQLHSASNSDWWAFSEYYVVGNLDGRGYRSEPDKDGRTQVSFDPATMSITLDGYIQSYRKSEVNSPCRELTANRKHHSCLTTNNVLHDLQWTPEPMTVQLERTLSYSTGSHAHHDADAFKYACQKAYRQLDEVWGRELQGPVLMP